MKDLLDHNLIEHNNFLPREFEFSPKAAISSIVDILASQIRNRDVKVARHFDPSLCDVAIGDVDRIQQVLMNIVFNACKFVPVQNGKIDVYASLDHDLDDSYLKIKVTDNGPGISAADIPKLFQPFAKLEATKHLNPSGTGLGLNICKMICNSLGGGIEVASVPNKQTTFTFWVKIRLVGELTASLCRESSRESTFDQLIEHSPVVVKTGKSSEVNIICADDKYFNLEDLRLVFQKLDLVQRCTFVSNGNDAVTACIKIMEKQTFDQVEHTILFLDYDMPVMTGIEVINEIQAFCLVNNQHALNAAKIFS
jgi:CheY-like chemotaxis protein